MDPSRSRDADRYGLDSSGWRADREPQQALVWRWRNWTLTAAAELEGEADLSGGFELTSADVIRAFTTDKLLEMITTRIDPEKSIDVILTMGFKFEDTNERYALQIRRGVVQFHSRLPEHTDIVMVTDRAYLNRMLLGDVTITGEMASAIAEGAPKGMATIMGAIDSGKSSSRGARKRTSRGSSATSIHPSTSAQSG